MSILLRIGMVAMTLIQPLFLSLICLRFEYILKVIEFADQAACQISRKLG